ncbi:MAG TPA: tyrosine-protein phosphatase [Caulobacteraceae bacterium]
MTRHLTLEGVDNFRDFGDYPVVGGGRLKRGRLYRSASHGRATPPDLEAIGALGLELIVDLRRKGERLRDPSQRHASFAGAVIDNDIGDEEPDPWHEHIRASDLSEASFRAYLLNYYRLAPFSDRHVDLFRRYFRALAGAEGPVLVHCVAGKDRTGLLAALTHHIAGVHPDDIVADYLLTNNAERIALRIPMVAKAIEAIAGRSPEEAALRTALGVEAIYLRTAFDAVGERYGDLDAYLETALGVDRPMRAALQARLREA